MLAWLAAAAIVAGAAVSPAEAQTLRDLRWQKRVLVLLADDETDGRLAEQRREVLSDEAALAERDMLVFALAADRIVPIYGTAPRGETARSLADRLGGDDGASFEAILVGLDGGIKWRRSQPVPLADILGVIDAMPMRRAAR